MVFSNLLIIVFLFLNLGLKMKNFKYKLIVLQALLYSIAVFSCQPERNRILYVNSYHPGYKPSDEVMKGIKENLPSDKYDLKIIFIDSKRQTSAELLAEKIDSIRQVISEFRPQLLIVSDDYAVNYLVKPFFNQSDLPVVFCGVNWSADQYNLSRSHITGMLEVLPLHEAIKFIKEYYPASKKLVVLSENSLSEQNNTMLLDTLYNHLELNTTYLLADNFEIWEKMFIKANEEADIIYLPTNGSIKGWNNSEAKKFVEVNIKKPLFTCDDFMMDYCVFGFTKVPIEQGIYAAETTKNILKGMSPAQFPLTRNVQTELWFNKKLAQKIGFKPDKKWLNTARLVGE